MLYYSQRHGKDIEAEIIEYNAPTQQVQLNIKKGQWIGIDRLTPICGLGSVQELYPARASTPPYAPYVSRENSPSDPAQMQQDMARVLGPSLKKGDKVFLFSQSLGKDIPAHVEEVHPDGSVELDVKKKHRLSAAEQAERITRTYPPPPQLFRGDQVLYWTVKQVSDATVTNVDGATGSVELSIQPGVFFTPEQQQQTLRVIREPRNRTRTGSIQSGNLAPPPFQAAANGYAFGNQVPIGATAGIGSNNWLQQAQGIGSNNNLPYAGQWKHAVGSKVKYFSASNADWIDAIVQGHNIEVGTYRLNVQSNADPARIRAADDPSASKPKGMGTAIICTNAQAKPAPKSDKDKSVVEGTILEDKPDVKWDDIAGLQVAKDQLMMAVVLPTKFPNMFTEDRPPPRGILLYGPPGTGKTHLARACATASSSTFFHVKSSDIMSKFQGESEKSVANLFEVAQERAPSIIFLDEVDSFFGKRGSEGSGEAGDKRAVKNTFLQCMESFNANTTPDKAVLVLAATNIPWELDEAFIRRFQAKIYIPPPDHEGRRYLLRQLLSKTKHSLTEADVEQIAEATRGYSGSDIKNLAHQALMRPVIDLQRATAFRREVTDSKVVWVPCSRMEHGAVEMRLLDVTEGEPFVRPVTCADFEAARLDVKASIQDATLAKIEEWTELYGSKA